MATGLSSMDTTKGLMTYDMLPVYEQRPRDRPAQSAEPKTYPRRMTVYQHSRSTWQQNKRIPWAANESGVVYGSRQAAGWNRLRNVDAGSSGSQNFNPFASLAGMYGATPESVPAAETPKNDESAQRPAGWRLFLILLSGALPYIAVVLDDTIVATIIPLLVAEFQQPADIGWYATAYFLPMAVLMPLFGKCYSLWKIKWLFSLSLVVLLAGSTVCGTTSSSTAFIVGRAISGSGAAGIISGAMRIIGVSSARKQRTLLEAAGAVVMGGCTVAGPIVGGVVADSVGWRWAFLLNVPLVLGALAVILWIFPDEVPTTSLFRLPLAQKLMRLDPVGALTLIGALCCLVMLLESQATSLDKWSTQDTSLAIAAGALFAAFFAHESFVRPDLALIPRSLVRHRAVWSCGIMLFFLFAGFINFVFFLPVLFQSVLGQSAQQSAISLLPYVVASSTAAMLVGIGVFFLPYYNPFFYAGGAAFVSGAALIFTLGDDVTVLQRALYEAVLGSGAGLLILANVAPCHIQLQDSDHSLANGFLFLSSLLGATLSLPISNTIFNRKLLAETMALQVPPPVKLEVVSDPTKVRSVVPAEFMALVLTALVDSIRQAFLVGLICAACCALATGFVPFKRLLQNYEESEHRDAQLQKLGKTLSADSFANTIGVLDDARPAAKGQ